MASIQRMDAALDLFVKRSMRDTHTNIRAKIVDVDYSIPSITALPMASTAFDDGTIDSYPAVFDIPIYMPSANGGKARLTMPIKSGDTVGLSFSERNESDTTDTSTHGLFPGWAVSQIFSDGNATAIDPNNVELWNDQVHFAMTPEGDFTLNTPAGTLKVDKSGEFSFNNGAASITAKTDGNIDMNGAKVTPDGNFITARGVNMNDFYDYFLRHTHHYYWTDGGGDANTNTPND